jgi:putative hydrolase of the HAD superfamily
MKPSLRSVRLIAFDLDDTLYPELAFVQSGFRAVARVVEERFSLRSGFYDLLWDVFSTGERRRTFDTALQRSGLSTDDVAVEELVHVYRSHLPDIALYPDAREILEILQGRKKTGLITDGYLETQQNKFTALSLDRYIDKAVFTDAGGRQAWKPSLWGYQQLMEHFSLPGAQCAYVGDNGLKDFAGAKALGWMTFNVIRYEGLYKDAAGAADCSVHSLAELIPSI